MILTFDNSLKIPCKSIAIEDSKSITEKLFEVLYTTTGIGLSANQIGIDARVCVIDLQHKSKPPIHLVNPTIVEQWDKTFCTEQCLSFPGKEIRTERYKYIIIEDDAYEGQYYFGPQSDNDELGLLESVCAQHEIDHLNGKTMFDREIKLVPEKIQKTYGRNEKVTIYKGSLEQIIKWKKAHQLIENEGWNL